jgi:hypothetical protein
MLMLMAEARLHVNHGVCKATIVKRIAKQVEMGMAHIGCFIQV